MKNFTYYNPTRIIFGKGAIAKLGSSLSREGIKKVLMVYGKGSIFKNGVYEQVTSSLKASNIEVVELSGVKPNPVLAKVKQGIEIARQEEAQAILAVGGGSVFDTSKSIAAGFFYDGDVWDFFSGQARIKEALPVYGVLTISATGSEMNNFAVITKEEEKLKWSIASNRIFPQVSIIDPSIQATLPASETVNGAADIISHVFEYYFDGTSEVEIMQEYSEMLIRTVMKHVKVLLADPANYNSRCQMSWAATLALNGSNATGRSGGDWATHTMEESLSAFYDVAHGAGLAILFPAWMRYVYRENMPIFERFADKIMGISEGESEKRVLEAINKLTEFYKEIGAPVTLQEIGVKSTDLESMAENAVLQGPLGSLKKLNKDDVLAIFKLAYGGE